MEQEQNAEDLLLGPCHPWGAGVEPEKTLQPSLWAELQMLSVKEPRGLVLVGLLDLQCAAAAVHAASVLARRLGTAPPAEAALRPATEH